MLERSLTPPTVGLLHAACLYWPRFRAALDMPMVDIDALEQLLIDAARSRRTLAYSDVLSHFGKRVTPIRVYALCRDLGAVSKRNRERREPELAVLVVRKTDRLPGEGFFHGAWKDGTYDGPATGPEARAYIDGLTETVFDYFDGHELTGKTDQA